MAAVRRKPPRYGGGLTEPSLLGLPPNRQVRGKQVTGVLFNRRAKGSLKIQPKVFPDWVGFRGGLEAGYLLYPEGEGH